MNFKDVKSLSLILPDADFFELKTNHPTTIRTKIDEYILANKPYSSLTNNCAHFLHFVLRDIPDVHSVKLIIPKYYYAIMKKLNTD